MTVLYVLCAAERQHTLSDTLSSLAMLMLQTADHRTGPLLSGPYGLRLDLGICVRSTE